jgi:RimJ/RimL family protein N-acetyltransferase
MLRIYRNDAGLAMDMHFVPVKEIHANLLWRIMEERLKDPIINISHQGMPDWLEHKKFISSKPYKVWHIIKVSRTNIGHCYITKNNEIGIFLLKKYQGLKLSKQIIAMLIYENPINKLLANINPLNERSKKLFTSLGFRHIQNTYELDTYIPILSELNNLQFSSLS